MKKKLLFGCMMILFTLIGMNSCKKDTPPPTGEFTFVVNGFEVTFTSTVKNATAYAWDFGDEATSTEANPVHTYIVSGTYTVTLTLTGEGGEGTVSKDVEILPSFDEMLTGGPTATNGKTWVLSRGYTNGVEGGSAVEPTMFIVQGTVENALTSIGLDREYDNEFTFHSDGSYEMDIKNDTAVTALLYGIYGGETLFIAENNALGLGACSFTAPESSTWTLHEDNLVIDAVSNPLGTDVPAIHGNVTFTGKKWISLSEGAYFGILDFPTTRQFIIKEITPDHMTVALFVCAYWADAAGSGTLPTWLYHLTFVPKTSK
jgi:PKD repeat protein